MIEALANPAVLMVLRYMSASNQHRVYLKLVLPCQLHLSKAWREKEKEN